MKVHQPNLPHPDFIDKSLSKSKFADSIVEADTRIGHIMDKLHQLGLDKGNTLVFWTTDNGAGRMSIRTPAIRPSAAPRAPTAKAATAFPPLRGCRGRSRPAAAITTSWAAWILWRPLRHWPASSCRKRISKVSRPSSTVTTCHRCSSAPARAARHLVLLHRERTAPRRHQVAQLQVRLQPSR